MGFFDDIFGQPFGGMFDFNGDGKTDFGEQWVGHMIINECMKEEKENTYSGTSIFGSDFVDDTWRLYCEDGSEYGLDPEDYSSEYEYEEALAQAKVAWRATCEDGFEYDIDPEDYDTEEEYIDALEEARAAWREGCEDGTDYGLNPEDYDTEEEYADALEEARTSSVAGGINIPITLTFSVDMPGMDALNAIKPADYPNKRQYDAAYHLCDVEQGTAYIPDTSSKMDREHLAAFLDDVYVTGLNNGMYAATRENEEEQNAVLDEFPYGEKWLAEEAENATLYKQAEDGDEYLLNASVAATLCIAGIEANEE